MGIMATDTGGKGFEPLEAGTYVARCVNVVDLGVQETGYGPKEKVYLGFEVPGERVEWTDKEGKEHEGPAFVGSRYTLSISEKSILGQHLTSWRGKPFTDEERKGFDITNVLGAPCMVNIVHEVNNGKTYANIVSIMRLPKGMECPDAESELIAYTPMDTALAGNFDKLPDWQQKLVRTGYKMAEGSSVPGSALAPQTQAPPAEPPAQHNAATTPPKVDPSQDPGDYFDDDIPF